MRLFLPLSAERARRGVAALCPELEPVEEAGLTLRRRRSPPPPERLAPALACLARLWEVRLDGRAIEIEPYVTTHPKSGARGLVAYLPARDLEPGTHLLTVVRSGATGEDGEELRTAIRFWR